MKNYIKFSLFILFIILALTACEEETTLMIKNESSRNPSSIEWNNISFGRNVVRGTNVTKTVTPGTGFIYLNNKTYRTQELFTITKGEKAEFVLLDSTIVVRLTTFETGTWVSQPGN